MLGGLLSFFFLTTFGMFLWRQVSIDRVERIAEERRAELRSAAERDARMRTDRMLRTVGIALSHALSAVGTNDAPADRAWDGADSILRGVGREGDLDLIALLGQDGTVVSSAGRRADEVRLLSGAKGPGAVDRITTRWEPPGRHRALVPLVRGGERIGTLVIVHELRPVVWHAEGERGSR